jgi:hypothetical protein
MSTTSKSKPDPAYTKTPLAGVLFMGRKVAVFPGHHRRSLKRLADQLDAQFIE